MAIDKRKVPEINASQMADISFLLLIFWLCSTTMSTDQGLSRRLPPLQPNKEKQEAEVHERDILLVLINSQNQLLVNKQVMTIDELAAEAKAFILNENDDLSKPERFPMEVTVEDGSGKLLSELVTSKHVISLQNDRGTTYEKYIEVQNALVKVYNEVRDEYSKKAFAGKSFNELTTAQQDAVSMLYPQKISEAEPKNYGGKK